MPERYVDTTYLEGSKVSSTYDHQTLSSILGSSNKIRDLSQHWKSFKTVDNFQALKKKEKAAKVSSRGQGSS